MIGCLIVDPAEGETYGGDRVFIFPGCRIAILLTPVNNGYIIHQRRDAEGCATWNEQ